MRDLAAQTHDLQQAARDADAARTAAEASVQDREAQLQVCASVGAWSIILKAAQTINLSTRGSQVAAQRMQGLEVLLERARGERLTATAAAREAAAEELARLRGEGDAATRDAAVNKAVADAWQRDAQVRAGRGAWSSM